MNNPINGPGLYRQRDGEVVELKAKEGTIFLVSPNNFLYSKGSLGHLVFPSTSGMVELPWDIVEKVESNET